MTFKSKAPSLILLKLGPAPQTLVYFVSRLPETDHIFTMFVFWWRKVPWGAIFFLHFFKIFYWFSNKITSTFSSLSSDEYIHCFNPQKFYMGCGGDVLLEALRR